MTTNTATIVSRCLAERTERAIEGLLDTLTTIAESGSEKEPRRQKGADTDPLLAYEDGFADAAYQAAEHAREALACWGER